MNWTRVLIRAVTTFVALFLLGYVVPGFSGYSYTHLIIISLVVGILTSVADIIAKPESPRQRSLILFIVSAVSIYLYTIVVIGARPPLVSTLIAAAIIGAIDLI